MVFILLAILLTVARGLLRPFLDSSDAAGAKLSVEAGTKDSGLRVRGWVDRSRVTMDEPFRIWLALSNSTPRDSQVESIELFIPGFARPSQGLRLYGKGVQPTPLGHAKIRVPPGQSVVRWVPLIPVERLGSFFVTARFVWKNPQGTFEETMELGPIRSVSPILQTVAQVIDALFSLLGTLAFPLAIALLGWYFQQRQQLLVQERQAWNSMLPLSHQLNVKYYLPVISAIKTFQNDAEAIWSKAATEEELSKASFSLLLVFRLMREVDKNGGLYLNNREGEKLVVRCYDSFAGRLLAQVTYRSLSTALDVMRPDDSYTNYQRRAGKAEKPTAALAQLRGELGTWTAKPEAETDFALLFMFAALLKFEMNRIYIFWYGSEPEFPFKECERYLEAMEAGFSQLRADVEGYVQQVAQGRPLKPRTEIAGRPAPSTAEPSGGAG